MKITVQTDGSLPSRDNALRIDGDLYGYELLAETYSHATGRYIARVEIWPIATLPKGACAYDADRSDLPDSRYTVTKEGTGDLSKPWVARFCGEWIGSAGSDHEASQLCRDAYQKRMGGAL